MPVPEGIRRKLHNRMMLDITVKLEFRLWIFLFTLCIAVSMETSIPPSIILNSFCSYAIKNEVTKMFAPEFSKIFQILDIVCYYCYYLFPYIVYVFLNPILFSFFFKKKTSLGNIISNSC